MALLVSWSMLSWLGSHGSTGFTSSAGSLKGCTVLALPKIGKFIEDRSSKIKLLFP